MKKKLLAVLLTVAMLAQTITIFAADSVVTSADNAVIGGNEEIVYVPGENTVSAKVKFAMDMGLVTHYIPAKLATRGDLKKAMRLIFKDDAIFNQYYSEDNDSATITVDEAIVLFMDAAGYAPYIKMNTNADAIAYRTEATRRGLITGSTYKIAADRFTAELFYTMFYDALNMPIFGASYSNVGTSYSHTQYTLMQTELGLTKIEGVVNANSYTSLKGTEGTDDDALVIGNKLYRAYGLKNLDDFLGCSVIAYVDDEDILCSVAVDTTANNYLKLNGGEDIKEATLSYIEYYTANNRVSSIKLNPYASIMYNNVIAKDFAAKDFFIDGGSITFIDNNQDKLYDVIFIEELTSFYPKLVDASAYIIEDNLGNKYDVKDVAEGRRYLGIHNTEDDEIELGSIVNTTGVAIGVIYGTTSVSEVIVLPEITFEGVYSQYKAGDYTPYTIGENTYRLSPVYKEECAGIFDFNIGDRLKIYLDPYGMIMKAEEVANVEKYGYLFSVYSDDDMFESDVKMMLLPAGSKTEERSLAKSVLYNDQVRLSEDKFLSAVSVPELYNGGNTKPQLIRYKMNAKGEISEIRTATLNNLEFGAFNNTKGFQINYANSDGSAKSFVYYGGTVKAIQGKYRFKNTVRFRIPNNSADWKEYATTGTVSSLNDLETYSMVLYDIDDYYIIGAAVEYFTPSGENDWVNGKGSNGAIYVDQGRKIDSKSGDVINYMSYVRGGNEGSVDVAPRTIYSLKRGDVAGMFGTRRASLNTFDQLQKGDIVKWVTNADGHLGRFMVTFAPDLTQSLDNEVFEYDLEIGAVTESEWGEYTIMFGKVISKDINGMVVNADRGSQCTNKEYNRTLKFASSQVVTVYDISENKATKETFASVKIGDYVYLDYNELNVVDVIVYRP